MFCQQVTSNVAPNQQSANKSEKKNDSNGSIIRGFPSILEREFEGKRKREERERKRLLEHET